MVASLRFNPDVVCVGEMRDVECYSAVEASLTGHTVVSTVHAGPASAAHMRIALLCQKRFPIDFNTSLMQAGQAFPLVVYAHKLENNDRRIMDISECIINSSGEREYSCLYNYQIDRNTILSLRTRLNSRDPLSMVNTRFVSGIDVMIAFSRVVLPELVAPATTNGTPYLTHIQRKSTISCVAKPVSTRFSLVTLDG